MPVLGIALALLLVGFVAVVTHEGFSPVVATLTNR